MSNEKLTRVLKNKEKIVIMKGAMCMALNLKNDVIFKAFFARKGNEEFLIDFLEALLKIKIKTIKIEQEVDLGKLAENEKT